jgi:hypothetical protein
MIRQEWFATVHSDRFLLKSAAYSIKKLGFSQCSTLDAEMEIAGMITQNDSTNQQKHFSMGLYTIHINTLWQTNKSLWRCDTAMCHRRQGLFRCAAEQGWKASGFRLAQWLQGLWVGVW